MTACDLCSGTLWTSTVPSTLSTPDMPPTARWPCPRCLSMPASTEMRDAAHESQFYPWETPHGSYPTGPAWWEPDEQVPLWLPVGLSLGVRVLAVRLGCPDDALREGLMWLPMLEAETDNVWGWMLWAGVAHDSPTGRPAWAVQFLAHGPDNGFRGPKLYRQRRLSVLAGIPSDLPAEIRAAAALAVCLRATVTP